jgi:hypothetical protein
MAEQTAAERTRYVFVTGGVVSSLGKGITAASLGRLLKARGLRVWIQKFDPYLNVDPGTMSPYQHGEVFVTADGAETDLDLGHYERFVDENLSKHASISSGRIYWDMLRRERAGDYLGDTIQVVPHVTDSIKEGFAAVTKTREVDVVITEIGGTVGDIEGLPFLEAIRQFRNDVGRDREPRRGERQHEPQAGERTDQVRARVAEHHPLAQVVGAGDEHGPGQQAQGPQRVGVPGTDRQPGAQQDERLHGASGAQVEQVEQVGGEHEHDHRQDVVVVAAQDEQGQSQRAGGLERAGRELAGSERRRVAAPAARRARQRVVGQAEEGDPERVRRDPGQLAEEDVAVGELVDRRQDDQREQRGRHDQDAERERQLRSPVVRAGVPIGHEGPSQSRRENQRGGDCDGKWQCVHWQRKVAVAADGVRPLGVRARRRTRAPRRSWRWAA